MCTTAHTTINSKQLAELAGVHPAQITRRRGVLPTDLSINSIAEFVAAQTADLTEAECRLRVAVHMTSRGQQA